MKHVYLALTLAVLSAGIGLALAGFYWMLAH